MIFRNQNVLDQIAAEISNELWRKLQAREIPTIHIDGIRSELRSSPKGMFNSREMGYLEVRVLKIIIEKVG